MNRFAYSNVDTSVSQADRFRVMSKKIGPSRPKGRGSTGYDKKAGKNLEKRLRGYESAINNLSARDRNSITRPGSMKRNKRK